VLGNDETAVTDHYTINGLGNMVLDALQISGVNLDTLAPVDLAPIDEFHMGGRAATQYVIGMMQLPRGATVLDVGCGLLTRLTFISAALSTCLGQTRHLMPQ
jgi:hypothetical protein